MLPCDYPTPRLSDYPIIRVSITILSDYPTIRRPDYLWGAVGRWCGACGGLQKRRIPSTMVSMGEADWGISLVRAN